jgi:hypothetical protein
MGILDQRGTYSERPYDPVSDSSASINADVSAALKTTVGATEFTVRSLGFISFKRTLQERQRVKQQCWPVPAWRKATRQQPHQ